MSKINPSRILAAILFLAFGLGTVITAFLFHIRRQQEMAVEISNAYVGFLMSDSAQRERARIPKEVHLKHTSIVGSHSIAIHPVDTDGIPGGFQMLYECEPRGFIEANVSAKRGISFFSFFNHRSDMKVHSVEYVP